MKNRKKKNYNTFIILVLMFLLFVGFFYRFSNRDQSAETAKAQNQNKTSAVTSVLMRDLERNYPSTPKEVVKYYGEINQVLYGEKYNDTEFYALSAKMRGLFDEELAANQGEADFRKGLKEEIDTFHDNGWGISSFSTSASTDVERFSDNGYEFARLYLTFRIRQKGGFAQVEEVFLLRKDEQNHWRIYGWKKADD